MTGKRLLAAALSGFFSLAAAAEPFQWSWRVERHAETSRRMITVECRLAPGSYLYADATAVSGRTAAGALTFTPPGAVKHHDEAFGETLVYEGAEPLRWTAESALEPVFLAAEFQGCVTGKPGEGAICLAPESRILLGTAEESPAPEATSLPAALTAELGHFRTVGVLSGLHGAEAFQAFLQEGGGQNAEPDTRNRGFWAIFALVVLGGLGLNLTPCVLPMIPVNLAIIGAGGEAGNRLRGLRRGAAYGAGIALTYGALGAAASLTGSRFGTLNSSGWFNGVTGLIFVLLGLSMLGVFQLDFSGLGGRWRFGGNRHRKLPPECAAFGMGILAALLAGACVAPVVLSVLMLAARLYGEGVRAGILLPFALGLAMALPWPLAGAGMAVLPAPGAWMNRVKAVMGIVIIVMGGYFGYLGWSLRTGTYAPETELAKLEKALVAARAENRPVLIDFWATWCGNCRAMERILEAPGVKTELARMVVVKFQAEKLNDAPVKALLDRWNLPGLPSFVLLAPEPGE